MYPTLSELITILEEIPVETVFKNGFTDAHSYRGSYDNLGVEPSKDVTVTEMIITLTSALSETFTGYKGGEYNMIGNEEVFLASYGCTGSRIEGYKHTVNGYELLLNDDY